MIILRFAQSIDKHKLFFKIIFFFYCSYYFYILPLVLQYKITQQIVQGGNLGSVDLGLSLLSSISNLIIYHLFFFIDNLRKT